MSYISCEGSALIPAVLPPSGSTLAVGSVIQPPINVNPVASGALLQPIAQLIVPKGVWMITGTLFCDATVGGQGVTGDTGIAKDAVVFWRSPTPGLTDSATITLSAVFSSDGTNALTIPMTYTTSAGATYDVAPSPRSVVQLTRVA